MIWVLNGFEREGNSKAKLQAKDNISVLKLKQKPECHNQKEKNPKHITGAQVANLATA